MKLVLVFVKEERCVHVWGDYRGNVCAGVSSGGAVHQNHRARCPPFIPDEVLEREVRRIGKFASGFKTVGLGCKDPKLQHVMSLRRKVFMFLETQSLDVSFRVKHGDGFYMVYASAGLVF